MDVLQAYRCDLHGKVQISKKTVSHHNNTGIIVYLLKPQKQMNSKLPAIILAAALLGSCGGLRSTKQSAAAQASDAIYNGDTDSINIEDSDATNEEDSVHSRRHWKNPEYYVFDKPSDDSIAVWKAACEEYDSVPENIVIPTDKFLKSDAYLAFCDWLHVCHSNNEILLWRLNELMPAESSFDGEVQRYRYFCLQIDSLESCLPELGPQQEMNDGAYMCADLADLTAQIYSSRLRQALPSLCSVLEQEEAAYCAFNKAAQNSFDKCSMSPYQIYNGSASALAYAEFAEDIAKLRYQALIPFYLFVTDPENAPKDSIHQHISNRLVLDEYTAFTESIVREEEGSYPIKEQRSSLIDAKEAWTEWLKARSDVSKLLSGEGKKVWDNCTNNLKRSHLRTLKDRYNYYLFLY